MVDFVVYGYHNRVYVRQPFAGGFMLEGRAFVTFDNGGQQIQVQMYSDHGISDVGAQRYWVDRAAVCTDIVHLGEAEPKTYHNIFNTTRDEK